MAANILETVYPHDCPDTCSILATVEDGRVTKCDGDPDHPFTQGGLCHKVHRYAERIYSPLRVLFPMRRVGRKGEGRFARIAWDEALAEVTEGVPPGVLVAEPIGWAKHHPGVRGINRLTSPRLTDLGECSTLHENLVNVAVAETDRGMDLAG